MMPAAPPLLSRGVHLRQYSGDGIVRKSFAMHFKDRLDYLLFAFVIDDFSGDAPVAERQVVSSE